MRTVYYTNHANIFFDDPEPLLSAFSKDNREITSIGFNEVKKCPAFKDACENTFVVRNSVDYELFWDGNGFSSNVKDQAFFDKWVFIRSPQDGFISYRFPSFIFWTEDPLDIELLPSFMHQTDLTTKTVMIPGRYDIGRHVRSLELALRFTNKNELVTMNKRDPLCYVRFHTKEKIKFQKFYATQDFIETIHGPMASRNGNPEPLEFWYDIFTRNYRKRVMKLIKQNLL